MATAAPASQPAGAASPEEVPARRYVAFEQTPIDVEIADLVDARGRLDVYPAVESKDYFVIALSGRRLRLRARGYVGLIPLNDRVVIDVRPRVRIENFTRVLRVARYAPIALEHAPRRYALEQEWDESLLDVYSEALTDRVEAIRLRGLLREYERHQEVSSYPKGRILVRETATRLAPRGLSHVAASTGIVALRTTPRTAASNTRSGSSPSATGSSSGRLTAVGPCARSTVSTGSSTT